MDIREEYKSLPISAVVDEVLASLTANPRLILTAPPGAGKSTLLPLILLNKFPEGQILMLEPRRIAARQVAIRMAEMLGEEVGMTVGYRMRFDNKVGPATRVVVMTEGVLERKLLDDPTLEGVVAVIFDEFHERSLSADLSLALVREIQNLVRPDLRIVIMSATIDASPIAKALDASHIHSPGKCFNVELIHCGDFDSKDCAQEVARYVMKACRDSGGNILAFLPGQGEILKCRDLLIEKFGEASNVEILTLYGMMSAESQRDVMKPAPKGMRRIVLATPIAETSLTIDGITIVIDSGLYRTPVFEPSTGLTRLITSRITLDMAAQRAGRAGRLMPGVCYRLWSKGVESRMKDCRQPEILTADLSPLMLALSVWGSPEPMTLPWLTSPPVGHISKARTLLSALGAIDEARRLTEKGNRMAKLPCHPRISSMLTEAGDIKALACDVAALLDEKDPCNDERDADLTTRINLLHQFRKGSRNRQWNRINEISAQYKRMVKVIQPCTYALPEDIGRLIAMAYPERIAMRDVDGGYHLAAGGSPVKLHPADDLARHEFLAIAAMSSRIHSAAPISKNTVISLGKWMECASWNPREGKIVVRDELRLGLLLLATRPAKGDVRERVVSAIASAAPKDGLTMFDFNDEVRDLQVRISIVAEWHPELGLPDVATETILARASEWLPLYIGSASGVQELRKIEMAKVILGFLSYDQQKILDKVAPTYLKLPTGRNVRIRYRKGAEAPVVSARLQDCFGLLATPRVDEGRRLVLMELLSPGFKPVQLTQDMEGFWKETYFEIRKELRRRYPKHRWPENPLP